MRLTEQKVLDYVLDKNMISKDDKVVVGVSGGADSVCLLVWLSAIRERFNLDIIGVHVHHGIRGEEANRDMQFTMRLCERLGIELVVREYDVPSYSKENGLSEEEAGRKLRYLAFNEVLSERNFNKIAVAHHSEDSAETILFNMLRGSRAKGLRGIAPINGRIIRPLMCLTRAEIEEYLRAWDIGWCIDSTNTSEEYSRNRIRETIIPSMQMINSQAVKHILETGDFIGELYDYLEKNVEELYTRVVTEDNGQFVLNIKTVSAADRLLRCELFKKVMEKLAGSAKDITAAHIKAIDELLGKQSGRRLDLPYNIEAVREQNFIKLRTKPLKEQYDNDSACMAEIVIDKTKEGRYTLPYGLGELHVLPMSENFLKFEENICTKFMDCDKIEDILTIRTRREGDYLLVNQGKSKKKLKEYFIDNKIPVCERDKKLLLADGSHILWVLGYRMSDGCKIKADTRRQIKFTWNNNGAEDKV